MRPVCKTDGCIHPQDYPEKGLCKECYERKVCVKLQARFNPSEQYNLSKTMENSDKIPIYFSARKRIEYRLTKSQKHRIKDQWRKRQLTQSVSTP